MAQKTDVIDDLYSAMQDNDYEMPESAQFRKDMQDPEYAADVWQLLHDNDDTDDDKDFFLGNVATAYKGQTPTNTQQQSGKPQQQQVVTPATPVNNEPTMADKVSGWMGKLYDAAGSALSTSGANAAKGITGYNLYAPTDYAKRKGALNYPTESAYNDNGTLKQPWEYSNPSADFVSQNNQKFWQDMDAKVKAEEERRNQPAYTSDDPKVNDAMKYLVRSVGQREDDINAKFNAHIQDVENTVNNAILDAYKQHDAILAKEQEGKWYPGRAAVANRRANEAVDPDIMLEQLKQKINAQVNDPKFLQQLKDEAHANNIDPEKYKQSVLESMLNSYEDMFTANMVQRNMPKSDIEHVLRGLEETVFGNIINSFTRGSNTYRDIANQMYAEQAGEGLNMAKQATTLVGNIPVYVATGWGAGVVTEQVLGNELAGLVATYGASKGTQIFVNVCSKLGVPATKANQLMSSMMSGGANLAAINFTEEAARQAAHNKFDAGELATTTAVGALTGVLLGGAGYKANKIASAQTTALGKALATSAGFAVENEIFTSIGEAEKYISNLIHDGESGYQHQDINLLQDRIEGAMNLSLIKATSHHALSNPKSLFNQFKAAFKPEAEIYKPWMKEELMANENVQHMFNALDRLANGVKGDRYKVNKDGRKVETYPQHDARKNFEEALAKVYDDNTLSIEARETLAKQFQTAMPSIDATPDNIKMDTDPSGKTYVDVMAGDVRVNRHEFSNPEDAELFKNVQQQNILRELKVKEILNSRQAPIAQRANDALMKALANRKAPLNENQLKQLYKNCLDEETKREYDSIVNSMAMLSVSEFCRGTGDEKISTDQDKIIKDAKVAVAKGKATPEQKDIVNRYNAACERVTNEFDGTKTETTAETGTRTDDEIADAHIDQMVNDGKISSTPTPLDPNASAQDPMQEASQQAYAQGKTATAEQKTEAQSNLDFLQNKLAEALGVTPDKVDETLANTEITDEATQKLAQSYQLAKVQKKGMDDAHQEAVHQIYDDVNKDVQSKTHDDGMIHPVIVKGDSETSDREGYIVKGDPETDQTVFVKFDEGEPEQVDKSQLVINDEPIDAESYAAFTADQKAQQLQAQHDAELSGVNLEPGATFKIRNANGEEGDVTIMQANPDGTFTVSDGENLAILSADQIFEMRKSYLNAQAEAKFNAANTPVVEEAPVVEAPETPVVETPEAETAPVTEQPVEESKTPVTDKIPYTVKDGKKKYDYESQEPEVTLSSMTEQLNGDEAKAIEFAGAHLSDINKKIDELDKQQKKELQKLNKEVTGDIDDMLAAEKEKQAIASKYESQRKELEAKRDYWNSVCNIPRQKADEKIRLQKEKTAKVETMTKTATPALPDTVEPLGETMTTGDVATTRKNLLDNCPTMADAQNAIIAERNKVTTAQSNATEAARNIRRTLADWAEGKTELTDEQVEKMASHLAGLDALVKEANNRINELDQINSNLERTYKERNDAAFAETATPADQRAAEMSKATTSDQKLKKAQEIYGDEPETAAMFDEMDVPQTPEELVAMNLETASINWEGKGGLQEHLGKDKKRSFGRNGDTLPFNTYLAKAGEGKNVDQIVHDIWESAENSAPNGEKKYTTEEIRDALVNILSSASKPSDIRDYVLDERIRRAEEVAQEIDREIEDYENGEHDYVPELGNEGEAITEGEMPFEQDDMPVEFSIKSKRKKRAAQRRKERKQVETIVNALEEGKEPEEVIAETSTEKAPEEETMEAVTIGGENSGIVKLGDDNSAVTLAKLLGAEGIMVVADEAKLNPENPMEKYLIAQLNQARENLKAEDPEAIFNWNGSKFRFNGKTYLLLNGQRGTDTTDLWVAGHEMGHIVDSLAKPFYELYKQAALNAIAARGGDIIEMLKQKRHDYKGQGRTDDRLLGEIVNDEMGNIFQNKGTDIFIDSIQGKKESANILATAVKTIKKLIPGLKDKDMKTRAEIAEEKLRNALRAATIAKRLSVKVGENTISFNAKHGIGAEFSATTYDATGRELLQEQLKRAIRQNYMTEDEANEIKQKMEMLYEVTTDLMNTTDENGNLVFQAFADIQKMTPKVDKNGNVYLSVVKNNDEYPMNIDFSKSCVKRDAMNAVLDALCADPRFDVTTMTNEDYLNVKEIAKKAGLEIPCYGCFVENSRYRTAEWANDISSKWNELVSAAAGDNVTPFDLTTGVQEHPVIDEKKLLAKAKQLTKKYPSKNKNGKLVDKKWYNNMAQAMINDPSIVHELTPDMLISPTKYADLMQTQPDMLSKIRDYSAQATPNLVIPDAIYNGDILQMDEKGQGWNFQNAYWIGGVRIQSASDFKPKLFFDYAQAFADLASKKLPAHTYSKVLSYAKLFGLTGIKINMSLFPKSMLPAGLRQEFNSMSESRKKADKRFIDAVRHAGLKWNQKEGRWEDEYAWSTESFPVEEAFALQDDPRYTANVGTLAVGLSDAHIWKLFEDPKIRGIIPVHKSNSNVSEDIRTNVDIRMDYTLHQNECIANEKNQMLEGESYADYYKRIATTEGITKPQYGNKISAADYINNGISWYRCLEKAEDPKEAAKLFVQRCQENGIIPRFPEFVYKEDGSYNENYYKVLQDFTLYDKDGNYAKQGAVKMQFPEEWRTILKESLTNEQKKVSLINSKVSDIVDQVIQAKANNEAVIADDAEFSIYSSKKAEKDDNARNRYGIDNPYLGNMQFLNKDYTPYKEGIREGDMVDVSNETYKANELSPVGRAFMDINDNDQLNFLKSQIRKHVKNLGGNIGNASAGAFKNEEGIMGIADPAGAKRVGTLMAEDLQYYKQALESMKADKSAEEPEYLATIDAEIEKVDKAINWYSEFADGQHNKIGDHDDDGIEFSLTGTSGAFNADIEESGLQASDLARMTHEEMVKKMPRLANQETAIHMLEATGKDWSKLSKAEKLKIKMATGWEKGADGKWRYEMPDGKFTDFAAVRNMRSQYDSVRLGDVWQDDKLFVMYPNLADKKIYKMKRTDGANGSWNGKYFELKPNRSEEEVRKTLIHEIQHYIQDEEGFAPGGNTEMSTPELQQLYDQHNAASKVLGGKLEKKYEHIPMFGDYASPSEIEYYKKMLNDVMNLVGNYQEAMTKYPEMFEGVTKEEVRSWMNVYDGGWSRMRDRARQLYGEGNEVQDLLEFDTNRWRVDENPANLEDLQRIRNYVTSALSDIEKFLKKWNKEWQKHGMEGYKYKGMIGYEAYKRLAGEVESRNTSARADMTEEQRRKSLAESTEDVKRKDQLFYHKGEIRTNKQMNDMDMEFSLSRRDNDTKNYAEETMRMDNDLADKEKEIEAKRKAWANASSPADIRRTEKELADIRKEYQALMDEKERMDNDMEYITNGGMEFSIVSNPKEIERLDKEPYEEVYHAMQLIRNPEDGKLYLYPPMAAVQGGKYVDGIPVEEVNGKLTITNPLWEQADERQDLAFRLTVGKNGIKIPEDAELEERMVSVGKGKNQKTVKKYFYNGKEVRTDKKTGEISWYFALNKGNSGDSGKKLTDLNAVAFDPYQHSGFTPVNDQFTTAYDRSHLVIVKVRVPKTEVTGESKYRADRAKLGVGTHDWTGGKLKTKKRRQVVLSRWDKPVEIVSDEEVAEATKKVLKDNGLTEVPFNIVTPSQREALQKIGVKIGEPTKDTAGKASRKAYEEWLKTQTDPTDPNGGGGKPSPEEDVEWSLGVPYTGSKNKIAKDIVDKLPEGKRFVDLFSGGGAMTHGAMLSGKYDNYHMNDIRPIGQQLFLDGIDGKYANYDKQVSKDDFANIKGTPESLLWSHMSNSRSYQGDRATSRAKRVAELETLKPMRDKISSSETDYRDVEIQPGDVLYADIPYEGTDNSAYAEGGKKFDYDAFAEWASGLDQPVYVSSVKAPKGFTEIWNTEFKNGTNTRTERLFVQDKFADAEKQRIDNVQDNDVEFSITRPTKQEKDDATKQIDERVAELNRLKESENLTISSGNTAEFSNNEGLPAEAGAQRVSDSGAKVNNKFGNTKKLLENLANFLNEVNNGKEIIPETFLKDLFSATKNEIPNQDSSYIRFSADGNRVRIRLSDHSANALNLIKRGGKADKGYSFVVKYEGMPEEKRNKNFQMKERHPLMAVEYVYDNPSRERMLNLAKGIFRLIDTGKYMDLADADTITPTPTAKAAIGDDIEFSLAVSKSDPFVSNAAKAVEGIKQGKATPEQWLKMIEKSRLAEESNAEFSLPPTDQEKNKKELNKKYKVLNSNQLFVNLQNDNNYTNEAVTELINRKPKITRLGNGMGRTYRQVPYAAGRIISGLVQGNFGKGSELRISPYWTFRLSDTEDSATVWDSTSRTLKETQRERDLIADVEDFRVEDWAQENGYWYEEDYISSHSYKAYKNDSGTESVVYKNSDGTKAIKFTAIDRTIPNGLGERLDEIALFNKFAEEHNLDTDIEVMGYGRNKDGKLCVITSQKWIEGKRVYDLMEGDAEKSYAYIDDWLTNNLKLTPHKDLCDEIDFHYNNDYIINDVNYGNVIVDKDGNKHLVDCYVELNDDSNLDGIRKYDDFSVDDNDDINWSLTGRMRQRNGESEADFEARKAAFVAGIVGSDEDARKRVEAGILDMINDKNISVVTKGKLHKMLSQVRSATAENIHQVLLDVDHNISNINIRRQQNDIDKLISMKTQRKNGKNISVAASVDDKTRQILDGLKYRLTEMNETDFDEQKHELNSQRYQINADNRLLEAQLKTTTDPTERQRLQNLINVNNLAKQSINDQINALQEQITEERANRLNQTTIDAESRLTELEQKQEDALLGNGEWTEADEIEQAICTLLKKKNDIKSLDGDKANLIAGETMLRSKITGLRQSLEDAADADKQGIRDQIKQTQQELAANLAEQNALQHEQIRQQSELIDDLNGIIQGGKESLMERIETENERKSDIILGTFGDIRNEKEDYTQMTQQEKKDAEQPGKVKQVFNVVLGSFEYLAQHISRNKLGKESWFYKHFVSGKDGVVEANNNFITGLRESQQILHDKCREIWGKNWLKAMEDNEQVVEHTGIKLADGNEVSMSKGQATYLYMVWKMPDGKAKLEKMGFNDLSIAQAVEFIGDKNKDWADWVQEDYLQSRREKYNAKHVEIFNTSMANIPNYVPLKVQSTDRKQKVDVNENENNGTINQKAGSLVNRTYNLVPVDLTRSAYDIISEHIKDMEEWNAYARVRQDLNYVLSSKAVRQQLNANEAGLYKRLHDAARIATLTYDSKTPTASKIINYITKGIAASNIAVRYTTAMKQMASVPAFFGYSQDPRYIAALTANIFGQYARHIPTILGTMLTFGETGKRAMKNASGEDPVSVATKIQLSNTIRWCAENFPSFRNRLAKGSSGNVILDEKIGNEDTKTGRFLNLLQQNGMAPNALVDAITCAIGIKTIYDYKYARLKDEAKSLLKSGEITDEEYQQRLEEADRRAKMDADLYYNGTQQSNHPAFLAPVQMDGDIASKMYTLYKNSPISYARKTILPVTELANLARNYGTIKDRLAADYMREKGVTADEAKKMAKSHIWKQVGKDAVGISIYGYFMGLLWNFCGKGLLGAFQGDDDDKDKNLYKQIAEKASPILTGVPGVDYIVNTVAGDQIDPLLLYDMLNDLAREFNKKEPESREIVYKALNIASSAGTGINLQTLTNFVLAIDGLASNYQEGDADDKMLTLMYFMNTPESNRKKVARELYKDESFETYYKNVLRAEKYVEGTWLSWLPGVKSIDKTKRNEIIKEYIMSNATPEQKQMLENDEKISDIIKEYETMENLKKQYDATADYAEKQKLARAIRKMYDDGKEDALTPTEMMMKMRESLFEEKEEKAPKPYVKMNNAQDVEEDIQLQEIKNKCADVYDTWNSHKDDTYYTAHEREIDTYRNATRVLGWRNKINKTGNEGMLETYRKMRSDFLKQVTE